MSRDKVKLYFRKPVQACHDTQSGQTIEVLIPAGFSFEVPAEYIYGSGFPIDLDADVEKDA
jgi:hypothetical protein